MISFIVLVVAQAALLVSAAPQSESSTASANVVNAPVEEMCSHVGGSQCCESVDVPGPEELQALISVVNFAIDQNTLVGHGCSPLIGLDATCNAQAVCCTNSYGAIFIGCNNIIL